jgi:hypothetical protein
LKIENIENRIQEMEELVVKVCNENKKLKIILKEKQKQELHFDSYMKEFEKVKLLKNPELMSR